MSSQTGSGSGLRSTVSFYLARLRERLWLKPLVTCVLSIAAAFAAGFADGFGPARSFPDISSESIERLLSIISASMLVIAVFAVGAMLSAYASASTSATPRSFPLVVADDVSQNALSTFVGAFIFSIVALVAVLNGYYGRPARFVLFLLTIFVFALVIFAFLRWVDRIARLGRLTNTIDRVEAATDLALQEQARRPTWGAARATSTGQGTAVHAATVGYVQNVDTARLQKLGERIDGTITVCAVPGSFATPGSPLAYIETTDTKEREKVSEAVLDAFVIGDQRTFESDPRFGLIVLSEIASRALSPSVNDPGTAIDIIGTFVRLFVRWVAACKESDSRAVECDRVAIGPIALNDMFDDAFNSIARDGASTIEVGTRLQKAFQALILLGHDDIRQSAVTHAQFALRHAELALKLPEEREAIRALAARTFEMAAR